MTCARKAECPVCKRRMAVTLDGKMHTHGKPRCAGSRQAVQPTLSERLIDVVLRLSVHPAGMTDWRWYERLCLECAGEVDECVKIVERKANDSGQGREAYPAPRGSRKDEPA